MRRDLFRKGTDSTAQVAGVLEQCQESNMDSDSGEPLISVPRLHNILALELATIQVITEHEQRRV